MPKNHQKKIFLKKSGALTVACLKYNEKFSSHFAHTYSAYCTCAQHCLLLKWLLHHQILDYIHLIDCFQQIKESEHILLSTIKSDFKLRPRIM